MSILLLRILLFNGWTRRWIGFLFINFFNSWCIFGHWRCTIVVADSEFLSGWSRNIFIGTNLLEANGFIRFDENLWYFIPNISFCFNSCNYTLISRLNSWINFKNSHEMSDIRFFLRMFKKIILWKHLQDFWCCNLNNIKLAKKMFLIFFIYFSLTYKDMIKRFFY